MEYHVLKDAFPQEMREAVHEFTPDSELTEFLETCEREPHTFWQLLFALFLAPFFPDYEVHGMLEMYPMHLLSAKQWKEIVPESAREGKLLDIGAGQGFVTERARDLFSTIVTTETSHSMSERLTKKGFESHEIDVTEKPEAFPSRTFDIVSILNVLDRCAQPSILLKNAISFMKDDGIIIITDPLPFHPLLRSKGSARLEKSKIRTDGTWEENLLSVYKELIQPAGLVPVRISRLPYVYKNTRAQPYIVLDDFLLVCKKAI